jgi:hypothetical protein
MLLLSPRVSHSCVLKNIYLSLQGYFWYISKLVTLCSFKYGDMPPVAMKECCDPVSILALFEV